jgi:hypothetical protein
VKDICANCGHDSASHEYTNPEDGHTEPSPCCVLYGRQKICGCITWNPDEEAKAWEAKLRAV